MEKILYFDCFAGISGDMTLGALLDLGLSKEAVLEELGKLGVSGYDVEIAKINRFSIAGTDVKVHLSGETDCEHHHHGHGHDEEYGHHHNHRERSLTDISHIINSSGISEHAKELSIAIFTEIAKAEAAVHGKSLGEVHFHEVGAVDSIVDIVGTAICIDMLGADRIICSAVHEGQGFVECAHGRLPIPVPAVAKMLAGSRIPIVTEDIFAELVTPTGFGILKTLKQSCGKMPEMNVEQVGYGFGKTETGRLNALRVVFGTQSAGGRPGDCAVGRDEAALLETNIDDCSAETLGYVMNKLMDEGALDSYFTPIYMKKGRPAYMLTVLCCEDDIEKLSALIFAETGTLGIRVRKAERFVLSRTVRTAETSFGKVRIKEAGFGGKISRKPEYEDCAAIAEKLKLPLREVIRAINGQIEDQS